MTRTTVPSHGTTTQLATFERGEVRELTDLFCGLTTLFEDDTVGGRYNIQVDVHEVHVQVNAPDGGITDLGEIMLHGWAKKSSDEKLTDDALFQQIVDRFGDTVTAEPTLLMPDQIADLKTANNMRVAAMFARHGDDGFRSWKS